MLIKRRAGKLTIALVICTCNGVKAPSITGRKDSPRLGRQESGAAAGILWPLRPPNESVDCPTDRSAYVCSMYDVRRRDIHFLFATWAPLSGTLLADPGSWLCSRECNTLHSHVARLTTTQIFKSCNRVRPAPAHKPRPASRRPWTGPYFWHGGCWSL